MEISSASCCGAEDDGGWFPLFLFFSFFFGSWQTICRGFHPSGRTEWVDLRHNLEGDDVARDAVREKMKKLRPKEKKKED